MSAWVVLIAGPSGTIDDLGARAYVTAGTDWARCPHCGGTQTPRHESDGWCELNRLLREIRDRARKSTTEQRIERYRADFAEYVGDRR